MEDQIRQEFLSNNFTLEDDDTAEKCAAMCSSLGMEPEEFVSKWELFYLNLQMDGVKVLKADLDGFKQFLEKERREFFRKKQTGLHFYTKDDVDMLLDDKQETEWEEKPLPQTPSKEKVTPESYVDPTELTPPPFTLKNRGFSLHTPADVALKPSDTPFARRVNKFAVQFTFNDHLSLESSGEAASNTDSDDILKRLKPVRRCEIDVLGTGPESGTRYMFDQIENRFGAVDKRLQNFAKVLEERLHRKVDDHVAHASQEKVVVVGRVCCEGEGHLNDNSVLLEGSVEHSNGQRVRLDLRNIPKFSFFPGQVIGVEGQNPSGFCLMATRIFDSIPLPSVSLLEDEEPPAKRRTSNQESKTPESPQLTRIVAAAGPFTTNDNLAYEPLVELFAYAKKVRPNLLILMGPYVDSEHPQIKQGTVNKSFSHIFQEEIRMRVEEYCEEMGDGCRVVLVPSHRDAHHDLIFPQPPFDAHDFEDPNHQITLLTNPGILKINEVTAGFCTTDILRHLSSEEVSRVPQGASSDRMTRLASHLLAQRSFYPLFPPAQSVPLDLTLAPGSLDLPSSPDILLLSSNLAPFVKVLSLPRDIQPVDDENDIREKAGKVRCVCINPGYAARGMSGGTFTEICFSGGDSSSGLEPLHKRLQVRVIRV
ncbi:hypothetical protein KC19_6G140800 [Ceratodon purpureus]|uniref:DNA polymerase alpha subunit B n=3 Tax=Ceratodon purpureus TaxID=3225 RepID=A0A8T0HHG6_CERPU|nr:hypothetical protein KC19_6G140800 [Ceratodon purpureus]